MPRTTHKELLEVNSLQFLGKLLWEIALHIGPAPVQRLPWHQPHLILSGSAINNDDLSVENGNTIHTLMTLLEIVLLCTKLYIALSIWGYVVLYLREELVSVQRGV